MKLSIVLSVLLFALCMACVTAQTPRWAIRLKNVAEAEAFAVENDLKYIERVAGHYIFKGRLALKKLNLLQGLKGKGMIKQVQRRQSLKRLNKHFLSL